jgi:hypothetical protein
MTQLNNSKKYLLDSLKNKNWVGSNLNEIVIPNIIERIKSNHNLAPNKYSTHSSLYSAAYGQNNNFHFPVKKTISNFDIIDDSFTTDLDLKSLFSRSLNNFPNCKLDILNNNKSDLLQSALKIIEQTAPSTYNELINLIDTFVVLDTDGFRSASHPHFIGALFIKIQNSPMLLATSIIHELAHQELFLINFIDRLVNVKFDYNEIHSPFQNRPRPPIGRLHSAHAIFRMLQFDIQADLNNQQKYKDLLENTILTFNEDELTSFSWSLIHEVY